MISAIMSILSAFNVNVAEYEFLQLVLISDISQAPVTELSLVEMMMSRCHCFELHKCL